MVVVAIVSRATLAAMAYERRVSFGIVNLLECPGGDLLTCAESSLLQRKGPRTCNLGDLTTELRLIRLKRPTIACE
jgi:hypothetical protein